MVHPASNPGDQCHTQKILADHVKVGIDAVEPIHEGTPLSVPTKHHITIGEALGSFVQWPKSLVLLGDNDTGEPIASKDKVEQCVAKVKNNNLKVMNMMTNESIKRNRIMDEEIFKNLTVKCRYFHDLLVQVPSDDPINAIQTERKRRLEIKPQVNMAFKACKTYGGKSQGTHLKWINVKCLQQSGSTDCVYYVMRYMHEIVKNHYQNNDLAEYFVQVGSYSQKEMDEVRDNLTDYIIHNWM